MFRHLSFTSVLALATACVLLFAGESLAQRGGGGGRSGGGGMGGGHGYGGFGGGYGGYGGFGGYGRGGYGYGGYGGWGYGGFGFDGWGYGGYPYLSANDFGGAYYTPTSGTVPYYYVPPGYSMATAPPSTSVNRSFYPPDMSTSRDLGNSALIEVRLPANAQLWFNGQSTSQSGNDRFFTTPELEPGKTFNYELRATWTDSAGQSVTRTRKVEVQANRPVLVDLSGG